MLEFLIWMIVANSALQQSFFVAPSDLPGMDFMTLSIVSDHNVSVRPFVG